MEQYTKQYYNMFLGFVAVFFLLFSFYIYLFKLLNATALIEILIDI